MNQIILEGLTALAGKARTVFQFDIRIENKRLSIYRELNLIKIYGKTSRDPNLSLNMSVYNG